MPSDTKHSPRTIAGRIMLLACVGPVQQDLLARLAVGDPMRSNRCPRDEQLLEHDEPLERTSLASAVRARPRSADPPAPPELGAELGENPRSQAST